MKIVYCLIHLDNCVLLLRVLSDPLRDFELFSRGFVLLLRDFGLSSHDFWLFPRDIGLFLRDFR
ncbi:hypothetical protein [Virgibacillus doumboii]|uniref:hypothetical protein n=1 Tax=Virgibacillus doumboii TaxID=2697503 RepID=UPI0013DF1A1E|nr:hypothetical protein [Virgibacillus doumboii]